MAACLIDVTGTSGEVLIRYKDSGAVDRYLTAGIGSLYLDDAGSDYTYTTLSGDAVASSLCITITESVPTCYKLQWDVIPEYGVIAPAYYPTIVGDYTFDSLIIGSSTYLFSDPTFIVSTMDISNLIDKINSLGTPDISIIAVAQTYDDKLKATISKLIIQLKNTADIPKLKISSPTTGSIVYIEGSVIDCGVPSGYTPVTPKCGV